MALPRYSRATAALASSVLISAGLVSAAHAAPLNAEPAVDASTTVPDAGLSAVTGPLPSTAESHPFGGADHQRVPQDLAAVGFVEEEFLTSGQAQVYTWPQEGPAQAITGPSDYTTRVLVRRPANAEDFSGTVVVEMLNPSNLFDLNIGWSMIQQEVLAQGHAWVGITAKPISVDALQTFDPERYGALNWANPRSLDDPANCQQVAADSSRETENGLVWDMYTQVGQWLRSGDPTNPLTYGGDSSAVSTALGWGYSQTGGYLVNYINAINPLVVQERGAPVYDGFTVAVAGGGFAGAYPMNQCESAPPAGDSRRQIHDAGVPVMRIMAQSDYLRGIGARRADSDAPGDRFRHHEMSGTGHATPDELYFSAKPEDIERADRTVPPMTCDQGERSRLPNSIFFNAALRNMNQWVREGVEPPSTEPIVVEDGQPVLDEFGNVQGGWRSPYLEVPTSTWHGEATGASFCYIAGWEDPFDAETMRELYPDRQVWHNAMRESAAGLLEQGLLTEYDAVAVRRDMPENLQPSAGPHEFYFTFDASNEVVSEFSMIPGEARPQVVFAGDWFGQGLDTIGFREGNVFAFARTNAADAEWVTMDFGRRTDEVLVGDWNGDGTDTIGVRRGNHIYLLNDLSGDTPDVEYTFGRAGDQPIVGDFLGEGDVVAVRRGNAVLIPDALSERHASVSTAFGRATDDLLVGDWTGSGMDTLAVRRGNVVYQQGAITDALAAHSYSFGRPGDAVVSLDWQGLGIDTVGIYRRG